MIKYLSVFLVLVAFSHCNPFERCDRNEAVPLEVSFPNCNTNAQFCQLRRNQPIVIRIQFAPRRDARALGAELHAWNGRQWNEWELGPRSRLCDGFLLHNQRCPVLAGFRVTYELRVTVPRHVWLNTRYTLHIRIQDEWGVAVACFHVNVIFIA